MSKKSFKGGIDSLLGGGVPERSTVTPEAPTAAANPTTEEIPAIIKKRGRPQTNYRDISKSSQEGCKESETRATFIIPEADLAIIKAIAYWEREQIKDVIKAAIREYGKSYIAKKGPIEPKPEKN